MQRFIVPLSYNNHCENITFDISSAHVYMSLCVYMYECMCMCVYAFSYELKERANFVQINCSAIHIYEHRT